MRSPFRIAAVAVLALGGCSHGSGDPRAKAPAANGPYSGPLPDIEVASLDGQTAKLRDLTKGRVAVIDLWATWCTPCRDVSARAAELAKSETPDKLVVIGVDEGEDPKEVRAFLDTPKTAYPIYVDTDYSLANEIGSQTVPTILVVDRDGNVRVVSHKLDARTVHVVAELLGETGPRSTASAPE